MLKVEQFNVSKEMKSELNKLIPEANKRLPNKPFYLAITHWDDGDYEMSLEHNETVGVENKFYTQNTINLIAHRFIYRKKNLSHIYNKSLKTVKNGIQIFKLIYKEDIK